MRLVRSLGLAILLTIAAFTTKAQTFQYDWATVYGTGYAAPYTYTYRCGGSYSYPIYCTGTAYTYSTLNVTHSEYDASGNLLTIGTYNGNFDADPGPGTATLVSNISGSNRSNNVFLIKYNGSGGMLWAKSLTTSNFGTPNVSGMSINSDGSFYLLFTINGTFDIDPGVGNVSISNTGSATFVIAKYTAAGAYTWHKQINSTSGSLYPQGIDSDNSGNLVIHGYHKSTTDMDPGAGTTTLTASVYVGFFAKYSSTGNLLWASQISDGVSSSNLVMAASFDAQGNIITAGSFSQTIDLDPSVGTYNLSPVTPGSQDAYFAKYNNTTGALIWAKRIGGGSNTVINKLLTDANSAIILTGSYISTIDLDPGTGTNNVTSLGGNDFFFARYDSAGTFKWGKSMGSAAGEANPNLAVGTGDRVYIAGNFSTAFDTDPGAGVATVTPVGSNDIFMAAYNADGTYRFSTSIGSPESDIVNGFSVYGNEKAFIGGNKYGASSLDFDPGPGTAIKASYGNETHAILAQYTLPAVLTTPTATTTQPTCATTAGSIVITAPLGAGIEFSVDGINYQAGTTFSSLPPGNYTVFARNSNIDLSDALGVVIQPVPSAPATPAITASGPLTFCPGGSVGLSTSSVSGQTYLWSNGANTPAITATSPGSYTVTTTVTASGCSATSSSTNVAVNPVPAVNNITSQTLCKGESTTTVTFTGGISGTIYNWTNNNTSIGLAASGTGDIAAFTATNNTNVPQVATIMVTAEYTANAVTCTGTPVSFTITVNPAPDVTAVPNQIVCANTTLGAISLTGAVTGTVFNWTNSNSSIGLAASGTGNINAFTATNATSSPVTANIVVTPSANGCTGATTSFSIDVNPSTVITTQPVNQVVCEGSPVTFHVAATGTGFTYQWRKGGVNIASATSSSYTIASPSTSDAANFDVVVSGTCAPTVTSSAATLTVNTAPAITTQPASQTVCAGTSVTFTVAATGTGLSYQWRRSGVNIPGAFASSYTIAFAGTTHTGTYDVVISGSCSPSITSSPANLIVDLPFGITVQPTDNTVCEGSPVTFYVGAMGVGISYQWRKAGVNIPGANAATYTLASASTTDAATYDVVVNGNCSAPVTSSPAILAVNTAPVITIQPTSQTVCEGSSVTFTVTALGTGLTYQWRKGGVNITSATASTYTIASTATTDAASYDVVVSGSCSPSVTSSAASLTVNTAPSISTQPTTQTVCEGSPVTFSVTTTGTGLTYQWRKGGVNITSATASSYTIASTATSDAASYDVVVSGSCSPAVTSSAAMLTVNTVPAITTQPVTQTVCAGSSVTFSVAASGTGLSYQWRKGGVNIPSATSSSYTIASTSISDAANYDVVVSGTCAPAVTSSAATLTVNTVPAITTQPVTQTVCEGSSVTFTVAATGTGLTYQWRKGGVNIASATSSTYTIASPSISDAASYDVVISGTCTPAVTSSAASLTVNTAPSISVQPISQTTCEGTSVTFSVTASGTGLSYQWRKGGVNIASATSSSYTIASPSTSDAASYDVVISGTCTPAVTSSAVTLTVNTAPSLSVQPTSQTTCEGSSVTFSVTASGTGLTYQWRKGGVNIASATSSSYTIVSPSTSDAASYDVVVSGTCTPAVTSSAASLTVNTAPSINTQPSNQTVCEGSPITFTVAATGTGLTYQWRKGGVNIASATSSSYTIASPSTSDAASYDVVVSGTCTPALTSSAATLIVNTVPAITVQPSNHSVCTGTSVSFTVTAAGTGTITYQWRKNGTNIASATSASYTIASTVATDAANYDVIVTGTCGAITSGTVTLTVFPLTVVNTQPTSQSICPGSPVTFTVAASGTGTLTYQWRKNGTAIAAATGSSYSIPTVTTPDAGNYDVVVTGDCGTVISNAAILTLNSPVTITSSPVSQTVCAGNPASFTVTATGSGVLSYQWRKNGTDIPGANAAAFTIASTVAADAANYDVVVTGTCGSTISSSVSLIVNPVTSITTAPGAQTVCTGSSASFTVTAAGLGLSYQWRKNGVNITGATAATLMLASAVAADAANYSVVITGTCGTVTSTPVALTVNPVTAITTNPVAYGTCIGGNATFTVTGSGTAPLTYQWRKGTVNIPGASSALFTLTAVTAADAANYDVIVSGGCGSVTSIAVPLTINPATIITTEPIAQTGCIGGAATFIVSGSGSGTLSYQWRKNGVNIPGEISSGYTISSVVAADAANYDVIVTGSCGSVTSTAAPLTINPVTIITTQPVAQTICAGTNTTFNVTATGTGTLLYQWRKNGVNINGATNATYQIVNTLVSNAGIYDVVVVGSCGYLVSSPATLTVNTCTAIPTVNKDIKSAVLMPNIIHDQAILRVVSTKAMKIDWVITDAKGSVVMRFSQSVISGQNDFKLRGGNLVNGTYYLTGFTRHGKLSTIRFMRL